MDVMDAMDLMDNTIETLQKTLYRKLQPMPRSRSSL
jgi:hypothetical protein